MAWKRALRMAFQMASEDIALMMAGQFFQWLA
jgi:hypothetical protein